MKETKGRILVTGATSGIGKATTELFAKNGFDVIITGRRTDILKEFTDELISKYKVEVHAYNIDVRSRFGVENFMTDIEKNNIVPDILLNNAGLARGIAPIFAADIDDWEDMIDTNIKGLLYITRGVLPMMIKKGSGHIINIGSTAGYNVYPGGNVYNATKFGVKALTDAMNIDLVDTKIRVSSVEPGMVETEFSKVRFDGDEKKASDVYKGMTPLTADDIAGIIFYIATLPERINIQHLLVTPTAQRGQGFVNKNGLI